jgi:UDP-N-acetylmuramate dehydrogenase
MDDFLSRRKDKQPLEYPSAGSTFKRPEGYFAGQLIEESGLKGFSVGDAQVSEKHAGFVINKGNAKASDVLAVIEHCKKTVAEKFGVVLEPEIKILSKD